MALHGRMEVLAEGLTLPDGQSYKPGATITCPDGEIVEIPPRMNTNFFVVPSVWVKIGGVCDRPVFRKGDHLLLFLRQNRKEWTDKYIRKEPMEEEYVPIYQFLFQRGSFSVVA